MASSKAFVEYVCAQMCYVREITYKYMFGEYGLYCDGIYFGMVCDNQLFIKVTKKGEATLKEKVMGIPYPSAKPIFLIEKLEDKDYLAQVVLATVEDLEAKKKK